MPESWGCNMMTSLKTNTGWVQTIVAFQSDASEPDASNHDLFTPNGDPGENDSLQPVCGRVRGGIF